MPLDHRSYCKDIPRSSKNEPQELQSLHDYMELVIDNFHANHIMY